jgi:hypothetical protein
MLRLHPSSIILAPSDVTNALNAPCPPRPQDTHAWDHITVRRARRKSKPTTDTASNLAIDFSSLQIEAAAPSSAAGTDTAEQEEEDDSREVLFPDSHEMLTVMDGALSSLDNLTAPTTAAEEFDTSNWVVYEDDDISEGGEEEEGEEEEYEADSESESEQQQQQQPMPLQTLTPRQLDGAGEVEIADIIIPEEENDDEGLINFYDLGLGLLPNNTRMWRAGRRVSGTRIEVLRDADIGRQEDDLGSLRRSVVMEDYDEDSEGGLAEFPPETMQALDYRKRWRQSEAAKRIIR